MKKRSTAAVKTTGKKGRGCIPVLFLLAIVSCSILFIRNPASFKLETAQAISTPNLLVSNTQAERVLESLELVAPTKTVAPIKKPEAQGLPLTAQAGEWSFVIQQIDVFDSLNDNKVVPDNGLFVAFVGELQNHSAEKDCMTVRQWKLNNSQTVQEYDFAFSAVPSLKRLYDLSDPGVLFGTCVKSNEKQRLFLVYDVDKTSDLTLTFYDGQPVKLNIANNIASLPTPTSTSTPTPTATPVPTLPPALLSLPITAQSDDWSFVIQSIDIYRSLDDNRVVPDNGFFIVFVGDLENNSTEKDCMINRQWTLANLQTGEEYTYDFFADRPLEKIYGLYGPGTVFGTCLESNERQRLFLIYDVEETANLSLTFNDSQPVKLNMLAYVASLPTATPLPTDTPTPTATPTSTLTPTPVKPMVTAGENSVNIRFGPSTDYEVIGALEKNQSLEIVGRNADSSWWQVSTPNGFGWIAASVTQASNVDDNVPLAKAPPLPTQEATAAPVSTAESQPAPTSAPAPAICSCSGDIYNCKDFSGGSAQACYNYCVSIGRGDIHRLDRDNDGYACE